jgi:hypothetical protein
MREGRAIGPPFRFGRCAIAFSPLGESAHNPLGSNGDETMYLAAVMLLLAVLPVLSILAEFLTTTGASFWPLVGKWFVFWAVGIRLFAAGLSQVFRPQFTATGIFNIKDPEAAKLVKEIGFGNLSIGLLGILTMLVPAWIVPAALAGGLFYLLAGIQHWLNGVRSGKETVALISDLVVGVILLLFVLLTVFGSQPTIAA